jgi:hypothetical protein
VLNSCVVNALHGLLSGSGCGALRRPSVFNTKERRQFLQKPEIFSNFFFFHGYGTIAV